MFTIEPLIGPLPLRFGMTPEQVASLLGPPDRSSLTAFGNRSESRRHLSLGYDESSERLDEAVFSPGSDLVFRGKNLFAVDDIIGFLTSFDANPQSAVGMVFFVKLGVRLSGFHDGDIGQKAIGLTVEGHWDDYLNDFVPFQ